MAKKSAERASKKPVSAPPSAQFAQLQFRLPPEFVKAYKQEALDRGLKLNQLLVECFDHFTRRKAGKK